MKYRIKGARRDNGIDVDFTLTAGSEDEARSVAAGMGVLVEHVVAGKPVNVRSLVIFLGIPLIPLALVVVLIWSHSAIKVSTMPKELGLDLGNNVRMNFVLIPAGNFTMGSPKDEAGRRDDEGLRPGEWKNGKPQIHVTLTKPFYMGVYEVTVDQYAQFVKDTGYKHKEPDFKQTGDHPVVNVIRSAGQDDAQVFCEWLSKKTGKKVVLPTEAQWEYACRAGSTTRFCFGDDDRQLGEYAWYAGNSGNSTHPVGQKKPNAWGLYDMHGNVREWCSDGYWDGYSAAEETDPVGSSPLVTHRFVLRGGSWDYAPADCRSASRRARNSWVPEYTWEDGDYQNTARGFRVVVLAE